MGRNGEGGAASETECCMCGDYGLSSELFKCTNCRFRSQHKYCSNLYPGAESYNFCNWCLSQKVGGNTTTSTSSEKATSDHHHHNEIKMNIKKRDNIGTTENQIKKQDKKFPVAADRSASPSDGRKRVSSNHVGVAIRRTRSEDQISNGGMIIKKVFKNKVRRYKLLDEVSS